MGMKLNKPVNSNYCATVVKIKAIYPLEGRDKIVGTRIFDNQVLVSTKVKVGDLGLFFPVETALSKEFLSANNLLKDSTLNTDNTKKGYFETNGRVKCVKFGGHSSEGMFIEIDSLISLGVNPTELKLGDEFDTIKDVPICSKYVPRNSRIPGSGGGTKKVSKLVDGQFRFHKDTAQMYKNIHMINPGDVISITDKFHGTSGISANIVNKKPLTRKQRFFKWMGFPVDETGYSGIFSSRSVVRNDDMNRETTKIDERSIAHDYLMGFLSNGMTAYYEIVGYNVNGKAIQKDYVYGCDQPGADFEIGKHFDIYVYRLTYTNTDGSVFEFSAKQVQQWCKQYYVKPVMELFYGTVEELYETMHGKPMDDPEDLDIWRLDILKGLKAFYLEKDCSVCTNNVPAEGVVIRIESLGLKSYKLKSVRFLQKETKNLTKGVEDVESVS